ncbi:fructosamine kinase family protein [Mucilaginibacter defluvii]|uniref:Fructosamine kinase family protein n=1 Tax=Mucilaginibacter defluvii TaxID=1196019 RepID=A0ABP9FTD9_9SPHI
MEAVLKAIEQQLNEFVQGYQPVSGGDINRAYRIDTVSMTYFVKVNNKNKFRGMFDAEAKGLNLIASTNTIAVPQIVMQGDAGDDSYLLLEWLDTKSAAAVDMRELGRQLADMHRVSAEYFGLPYNNYMGSLTQSNRQHSTWTEFFVNERLMPMISMARGKKLLDAGDVALFGRLYNRLAALFDEEPPSLIHGDLWGGNYLIGSRGKPYLIDPAVSYGHREFDIAMTTLFSGFGNEFYDAYQDAFPLTKDWRQRLNLWNIYPLLVHLDLFGVTYKQQLISSLKGYL